MRPDIVQPDEFAAKNWWKPLRPGPAWYYHTGRKVNVRPSLYVDTDTLDEEVASLVGELHRAGVPTWPSCAGHWWTRAQTLPLYERLRRDAIEIQQRGLWFTHTETGAYSQYRNPVYFLPWRSYDAFHRDVASGNGQGYLAFSPREGHRIWQWPCGLGAVGPVRVAKVSLYGIPSLVIKVEASTPEEQAQCWARLSRTV